MFWGSSSEPKENGTSTPLVWTCSGRDLSRLVEGTDALGLPIDLLESIDSLTQPESRLEA